jgi:hypothetical protein
MAALLSPLQLQAGSAFLQNQGIKVASSVTSVVAAYNAQPLIANLITAINAAGSLGNSTQLDLQTFGTPNCPALADSFNSASTYPVNSTLAKPGLTGIISLTANTYVGAGDVSKFVQIFNSAVGYCDITNIFINSAVNANTYLGNTFTNMDSLTTSALTDVNLATQAMGDDLYNAGNWINLGDLGNFGTPLALIQQIFRQAGTIAPLVESLFDAGVPENVVLNINDSTVVVTDTVQRAMYQAMTTVTGDSLDQVLRILNVWTPNINTLADLLNPAVMLPNSYPTLTTPTCDGILGVCLTPDVPVPDVAPTPEEQQTLLEQENATRIVERPLACELRQSDNPAVVIPVPTNNTGSGAMFTVNSTLLPILPPQGISVERLSVITPPGIALANKALANSLLQITNVNKMTLPQLADAFLGAETNKDLPAINAQTQAVPQADLSYYANTLAVGSGENGTILITDVIGTAVGTNIVDNLSNCVTIMTALQSANAFYTLNSIYVDMLGNIASETEIGNLIANAQVEISNIVSSYPTQTSSLNTYFSAINTQLTNEVAFQTKATLSLTDVAANSQISTLSFVFSLPGYGNDTKVGGTAQYLESVADVAIAAGQSVVGTLRDGRTNTVLNLAGVGTAANAVEDTPETPPPQATLLPSVFTERQARNKMVY